VQRIKAIQPAGAVRLAGYSYGASVAVEIAWQLQQQGCVNVESLVLLDGSPSFVRAHMERIGQRLKMSEDTAGIEAAIMCSFIFQLLFRFANADEVY